MTPPYTQFIFENYHFDAHTNTLTLEYSFDGSLQFTETFRFDFNSVTYDATALDIACQNLFFMAGVSYYKAYLAPEIVIKKGTLDPMAASFLSEVYQRGLGEFFYVNKLDPRTPIVFPTNATSLPTAPIHRAKGLLLGIGGGKDSLVSAELLRDKVSNLATWSVGHRLQLAPLVQRIGLPHYWVERTWDRKLMEINATGALNGHVPISAILACTGVIVAILSGRQDVIVSNEQSANEPTLYYQDMAINHQYSKSQEFEETFQAHLARLLGDQVRYYSLLRPLSELHIAELFAKHGFDLYRDVFSSCNRAFTHEVDHIFWDGTCPKCAFVFMALTPFVAQEKLEQLFSGKNLLRSPNLEPTYRQLLGIEGDKPLECVGEIKESRAAMRLSSVMYPELTAEYMFELPEEYDYKTLSSHHIPEEIYALLYPHLG